MIKDYSIQLNGKKIPNVHEVTVHLETPNDGRGIYREPTTAVTITVIRDASNNPIVDLIAMATNTDGRKNILTSGTIECHGDDVKDNYSFDIKRAFISHWELVNPAGTDAPTVESIELKVGEMEYKAGGKSATFGLKDFK